MSTRVCIIDVDLNFSVQDIIAGQLNQLTKSSEQKLDEAIAMAKSIETIKAQRVVEKQLVADAQTNALATTYQRLVDAGATGLPIPTIMELMRQITNSLPTVTSRLRKYMILNGVDGTLKKITMNYVQHLVLKVSPAA